MEEKKTVERATYVRSDAAAFPSLSEAARVWFRIGVLSFGGPAAQIALMHRSLVEETGWLCEKTFLNALSFCMLLPGPEAMQLATYAGWRLHGVRGGLVAGLLFVVPGALLVLSFAVLYGFAGDVPWVDSLFFGIKAAVIVIVIQALIKVAGRALGAGVHRLLAAVAFGGIFFFALPFPLIVVGAGLIGFLIVSQTDLDDQPAVNELASAAHLNVRAQMPQTCRTVLLWLVIWWLPIAVLSASGSNERLVDIGQFFSTLAVVTFGGAYAVLAYLAQDVVTHHGWLTTTEMMDGLALAETTPGPLILVTEFVGYLAAFRDGGWVAGIQGAAVTLWVTFVPCFLWIFAGAPYLEWISAQPRLRGALAAITAAVVGVILNLSLWFATHVLFTQVNRVETAQMIFWFPELSTLDWRSVLLVLLGAVLVFRLNWSVPALLVTLSACGALLLMF